MSAAPLAHTAIVDWDGTAVPAQWPEQPDEFMPDFVEQMFRLHKAGWHIIINSSRLNQFDPWMRRRTPAEVENEYQYVRAMLDRAGLTFIRVWRLPGKPGGDVYVDDKAERYTGTKGSWRRVVDKILLRAGDPLFPAAEAVGEE